MSPQGYDLVAQDSPKHLRLLHLQRHGRAPAVDRYTAKMPEYLTAVTIIRPEVVMESRNDDEFDLAGLPEG